MAIDPINGGPVIGGLVERTPEHSWPMCDQCSKRLQQRYPVEKYGILGWSEPTALKPCYVLTIEAECHGETDEAYIEIPIGMVSKREDGQYKIPAMVEDKFKTLRFFQRSGTGRNAGVKLDLPRRMF